MKPAYPRGAERESKKQKNKNLVYNKLNKTKQEQKTMFRSKKEKEIIVMKRMKKRITMILMVALAVMSLAVPASAKTVYSGSGSLKPNVQYEKAVCFTKKFFFHNTHTVTFKQTRGTAYYKKANGTTTTRKIYARARLIIKEGGENGKVVVNTIWNTGTFKYKCKTNTHYRFYVAYDGIDYNNKVKFGPLYFSKWKKYPKYSVEWMNL